MIYVNLRQYLSEFSSMFLLETLRLEQSTRLCSSTLFEFQTSDVSRALALYVGFN